MEAAITRLYEATLKGDITSFLELLEEDPLILDRYMIDNSGGFMQSPLHVAAQMGHLDIVKRIIELNPSMCLAHDQDGRTPIHVAATKGHMGVLQVLHYANCHAAQEKTYNGETILHLCVKHNQLQALQKLLDLNDDDGDQLLNSKDKNGNTILHLAVTSKQPKTVDYLLQRPTIEINAMNKKEMTAVDIYLKQSGKGHKDDKIKESLKVAKAKPAKDAHHHQAENTWLENQRSALMVVASLIATMAFQAGINPPGSVWQDTKDNNGHVAGTAIWSYDHKDNTYNVVLASNTIGLISSLSVILILISGLPCKRRFLPFLRVTLCTAVMASSISYLFSVGYVTGDDDRDETVWNVVRSLLITWIGVVAMVFLGHIVQLILKVTGWHRRELIKMFWSRLFSTIREKNDTNDPLDHL